MRKRIYLDNAATTPVDLRVLKEMMPYFNEKYGNPSSAHFLGRETSKALDLARKRVADFLDCSSLEVFFTGSATEANNLAILGLIRSFQKRGKKKIHIITSKIEHPAVLKVFHFLEKEGIKTTYVSVNKEGLVNVPEIEKSITKDTILISIMYANNEIGVIQPIKKISKIAKKNKIYFHTDAVQAINYLDCNVKKLGVDFLTLSGHKIYGPKGAGALFVRDGIKIEPLIFGGGHERGLRPGTENVPSIVGLGSAISKIKEKDKKKVLKLRDKLIIGILKSVPRVYLNGSFKERLPNNANFSFDGVEGESIILSLDQKGIAASTGSACSSKGLKASHVLLALGHSQKKADSSLRLSLGRYNTERDIEKVLKVLPGIISKLRKISGYSLI